MPKPEDVALNVLAILSMVFIVAGLIRLLSNGSYGLPLLFIGLVLFVVFILVVAALRRNRQTTEPGLQT